jgi:hypothetical protein
MYHQRNFRCNGPCPSKTPNVNKLFITRASPRSVFPTPFISCSAPCVSTMTCSSTDVHKMSPANRNDNWSTECLFSQKSIRSRIQVPRIRLTISFFIPSSVLFPTRSSKYYARSFSGEN